MTIPILKRENSYSGSWNDLAKVISSVHCVEDRQAWTQKSSSQVAQPLHLAACFPPPSSSLPVLMSAFPTCFFHGHSVSEQLGRSEDMCQDCEEMNIDEGLRTLILHFSYLFCLAKGSVRLQGQWGQGPLPVGPGVPCWNRLRPSHSDPPLPSWILTALWASSLLTILTRSLLLYPRARIRVKALESLTPRLKFWVHLWKTCS